MAPTTTNGTNKLIDKSTTPTLLDNVELTYLAEGAANVIYRISFPPSTPQPSSIDSYGASTPPPTEIDPAIPSIYDNVLLRLRKALPSAQPNLTAANHLATAILPLLPPNLPISATLVKLPAGLVARQNAKLTAAESSGARPARRHGLYLATDEPYGFLVTDMTPDTSRGELLVETKMKWLLQSPSAPKTATRCRTCALRLQKAAETPKKAQKWKGMCPLDLSSSSPARLRRAVSQVAPAEHVDSVTKFLLEGGFMPRLKKLQKELDPKGPLYADVSEERFLTCMTLRDCTIFLRIGGEGHIEMRVGDLDMKDSGEGKGEYWKGVEKGLIVGGWYEGKEQGEWEWKKEGNEVVCDLS